MEGQFVCPSCSYKEALQCCLTVSVWFASIPSSNSRGSRRRSSSNSSNARRRRRLLEEEEEAVGGGGGGRCSAAMNGFHFTGPRSIRNKKCRNFPAQCGVRRRSCTGMNPLRPEVTVVERQSDWLTNNHSLWNIQLSSRCEEI